MSTAYSVLLNRSTMDVGTSVVAIGGWALRQYITALGHTLSEFRSAARASARCLGGR